MRPPSRSPGPAGSLHLEITPLGWKLMAVYGVAWLGLAAQDRLVGFSANRNPFAGVVSQFDAVPARAIPLWEYLALHPPGGRVLPDSAGVGFHLWQLFTAPLVHPPSGFGALVLGFLGFGFVAASVERYLGPRRFLLLWWTSAVGASLAGFLLGPLVHPAYPHFGFGPSVLALLIVYCAMTPEAILSFFLVLPVKMKWIAWAVAGMVLIRALALNSPLGSGPAGGGYQLGGVLCGWLWFQYGDDLPGRIRRRIRSRQMLRVVVDEALKAGDDENLYH